MTLVVLGLGVLFAGWRAFLQFGPRETQQAIFRFHAKALVGQRASFPRPVTEAVLPVPRSMSSADVQLRLMKWREGRSWLPEALARGEEVQGGLRLHSGVLSLVDITRVGPLERLEGRAVCTVTCKLRWDFPEDMQELLRVRQIVELRLPKGLEPGHTGEIACTFARHGWRWELLAMESPWGGQLDLKRQSPGWFDWFF